MILIRKLFLIQSSLFPSFYIGLQFSNLIDVEINSSGMDPIENGSVIQIIDIDKRHSGKKEEGLVDSLIKKAEDFLDSLNI